MNVFQDPLKWSASIVSSWVRFSACGAFFVVALAYTVHVAASSGWRPAMGIVVFLAAFQLLILYALRRLFLKALGQDIAADDFDTTKWHFIWGVALFVVAAIVLAVVFWATSAV